MNLADQNSTKPLDEQLLMFARDFKTLLRREGESALQLRAAERQLEYFARDMRSTYDAERQRTLELEQAYFETIMRLTRAAQYKDEETGMHIDRLSRYSNLIARHLGLPKDQTDRITQGAPMHDVGKIGIPDAVLQKRGPLNPEEWKVMRQHSGIGASLLKGSKSKYIETAAEIALTHHERWDGTGYPQGLRGEEIPVSGRIVMLADQYDAMRSPRHYKPAFDHQKTRTILLKGDGRTMPEHFEPRLLEAFGDLDAEFMTIYEGNPE